MMYLLCGFASANLCAGFALGRFVQRQREHAINAWADTQTQPLLVPAMAELTVAEGSPQLSEPSEDLSKFFTP
jgi:hypothetical protein